MTVADAFAAIESHYLALFKPRVEALSGNLTNTEIINICQDILAITRDEEVDGRPFPVPPLTILEGNDKECVVGTVLDTTAPSLVYLPYRQMRVCADAIISILEDNRRGDWFRRWLIRYELPFEEATVENCIAQLQVVSEQLHGVGGAFAQAKELASQGEWRNV